MSHNIKSKKIALFGTGYMGLEYAKVLKSLEADIVIAVGRSQKGIEEFEAQCGIRAVPYSSEEWKSVCLSGIDCAIVAVNIEQLSSVTSSLIDLGIKKILLEKPGALSLSEIKAIESEAAAKNVDIFLAYNRRFYASVEKGKEMIAQDGGVKSFNFDFTEWSHIVEASKDDPQVKQKWVLANSSHVIDLAFYLGGKSQEINCHTELSLPWHSASCVFSGSGQAEGGALFSYHANWKAPGRWGVECFTDNYRFIFRPLEQLYIQKKKSVEIEPVNIESKLDQDFKPGLYRQTEAFLENDYSDLKSLSQQVEDMSLYYKIAGYSDK